MKRLFAPFALAFALFITGCAHTPSAGWVALIEDGKGLENFDRIGDANWRTEGGLIVADKGKGGHLVTKQSYKDFQIYAEFWADHTTNSGLFLRAQNPKQIGANNSYEVNIFDQRPGQEYSTGAIVDFARVGNPPPKAGGKWNTYQITMDGEHMTVVLNGVQTVHAMDSQFASGPIALQWARGVVQFRNVSIKPL